MDFKSPEEDVEKIIEYRLLRRTHEGAALVEAIKDALRDLEVARQMSACTSLEQAIRTLEKVLLTAGPNGKEFVDRAFPDLAEAYYARFEDSDSG